MLLRTISPAVALVTNKMKINNNKNTSLDISSICREFCSVSIISRKFHGASCWQCGVVAARSASVPLTKQEHWKLENFPHSDVLGLVWSCWAFREQMYYLESTSHNHNEWNVIFAEWRLRSWTAPSTHPSTVFILQINGKLVNEAEHT